MNEKVKKEVLRVRQATYMTPELHKRVKLFAVENNKNVYQVFEEALNQYLADKEPNKKA